MYLCTNLVGSMYISNTYNLQSVHRHFSGIHILIFGLKIFKDLLFLITSGTKSQILGAKYDTLLIP